MQSIVRTEHLYKKSGALTAVGVSHEKKVDKMRRES